MGINNKNLIEYNLSRTSRKNINITIKNDGYVYVSAPKKATLSEINRVVISKKDWILTAQKNIKSKKIIKSRFNVRNGAVLYIYGRLVKLKIMPSINGNLLLFKDNELHFYIEAEHFNDSKYKNDIFKKLLKTELENTINTYINKYLRIIPVAVNFINIRSMKSRWGSCIPSKKKIIFNANLIHCPRTAIEYVVLHEIVHLIHPNHSKLFYDTVSIYMPDWEFRRKILQEYVIIQYKYPPV